ncbi:MAG: DNA polymerase III subunit alpha [Candidatus Dojkabacteria bacterium]
MSKFTHLHLHTEYSLLDGVVRLNPLIAKLKEYEMSACAMTDHGNMYGIYKFYKTMKGEGLKPILGCEIYIAPRSRHQKEAGIDNKYYHLTVLAKNLTGYQNLLKIVSIGHMEGYYYKPRVDWEVLEQHTEGLIVLSGCLGGPVAKELLNSNPKQAKANLEHLHKLYKENFYVEIQRNGMKEMDEINPQLLELAKEYKLPIVATADVHYLSPEDRMVQEVVWCIADGKTLDDPTRRQMESDQFYLKSPAEMEELFKDLPEAIENTQKIADSIEDYSIQFDRIEPVFLGLPDGFKDTGEYLRHLTFEGCKIKYGEVTPELTERLDFELKVIHEKGYDDYFLITREFIQFCRDNGIVVGIRGSACGSAVAYCIDITHVEPISWELYFERFLNPERKSAPDIDIDIADSRRDEVIKFTIDRYGADHVKQIGTFSKLQTRQAIRDVSRVLGIDLGIADQLSKMVEIVFGKAKDIDYMIENKKEFSDIIKSSPEMERMASIVRKVAGLARGVSTHACGIVITPKPVVDFVPIQRDSKNEGIGMTQFEMFDLEEVGLMKFDFLGLRNLSVIGEAVHKIEDNLKQEINIFKLDPNDKPTYETLQSGHTVGIFQLESEGMKKTIRTIKPDTQEEICYLLAAYRPGPMQFIPEFADVKFKRKPAEYLVPDLEPILSITNGVITYQEQVIRIAVDIAGYTMGAADMLRKAMGKKKMEVMEEEKPKFINGAISKGYDSESIEKLWERLLQFANYGFNKAHAASYAMVSYWTGYLKTHYPLHFMAALLEGDLDNFDRVVIDLQECDRLGIEVLPPDINSSSYKFTIDNNKNIRFGLAAIKNVGEEIVKHVVEEREANGPYLNFDDFIYRNLENVQKRTIEYMILAGALDSMGDRNKLIALLEPLYERYKKEKKSAGLGQIDLFAGGGEPRVHIEQATPLPNVEEMPMYLRLNHEKELLGIYLSSHPLDDLQEFFQQKGAISISEVLAMKPSKKLIITAAVATTVRRITTKNNQTMAFMLVEDKFASMDTVVFPSTYEELKNELEPNKPMLIAGKLNDRNGDKSFVVEKAKIVDPSKFGSNFKGITFKVRDSHSPEELQELKAYIMQNNGDTDVRIVIIEEGGTKLIPLTQKVFMNEQTKEYLKKFH